MGTTIDKQIKGSNLCWTECSEKKKIVHPETCVKQVKIADDSDTSLEDWIFSKSSEERTESLSTYRGLLDWLQTYYPMTGSGSVPIATPTTLGVVTTGTNNPYLNLTNGVLTLNTSNLPTPTISYADTRTVGGIRMGSDSIMPFFTLDNSKNLSNVSFPVAEYTDEHYGFPLRYDTNKRAGIAIPKSLFSGQVQQVQSDWEVTDKFSDAYIQNKPVFAAVATSGDYNDLNNIPSVNYWDISYPPCNVNFQSLSGTNLPSSVVAALEVQIALHQSSTNVFKYASPININILGPIYTSVSDKLFSAINKGLEKLYDGNPPYVYCELNIKFTVSNEDAPYRVFSGDLYLTGSQSFTCINNTGTIDITNATISYIRNSEDNKDYLRVIVNNRARNSTIDCNLNIILSRAGANYQANVCLTTLPYTYIQYTQS